MELKFLCDQCGQSFIKIQLFEYNDYDQINIAEIKTFYRKHRISKECRGHVTKPTELTEDDRWFL